MVRYMACLSEEKFANILTFMYFGLVLSLSFLIGCTASSGHGLKATLAQGEGWKEFKGAWFTISYPPMFKLVPSLLSSTADGYDSA